MIGLIFSEAPTPFGQATTLRCLADVAFRHASHWAIVEQSRFAADQIDDGDHPRVVEIQTFLAQRMAPISSTRVWTFLR
ncbi:hypothetical protein [Mycobacteroides abscessus]